MLEIRNGAVVALLGLTLSVALGACQGSSSSGTAGLKTDDQLASYGVGRNVGRSLQSAQGRLDMDAFLRGVKDAMSGADPAAPQDTIQAALKRFSQSIQAQANQRRKEEADKNKTRGEAYLKKNESRDGVTVTKSGLQYEVLKKGNGPTPDSGQQVTINYKGTLVDGTVFDSTPKGKPATFGVDHVIPGFSEGLKLMQVGSRYRFVIPSDLAYGERGAGQTIGPNETLIFEVELLDIK